MHAPAPHYLLFSESDQRKSGAWRFVLQSADGTSHVEAEDAEAEISGERLALLAVVRGLEALPAPARVTLVTPSKYVSRALNYGLDEWRDNNWHWERFGHMVPVKNRDLWQRVDRALQYHRIECRPCRIDPAHVSRPVEVDRNAQPQSTVATYTRPPGHAGPSVKRRFRRLRCQAWRKTTVIFEGLRLRVAQFGTGFLPIPWLE